MTREEGRGKEGANSLRPSDGAITVLGVVPSADLGVTLTHEHLLVDVRPLFTPPPTQASWDHSSDPVSLENLGWIRFYWTNNRDNLLLDDEGLATDELRHYAAAGGHTIVDCTITGIGRQPEALRRMSRATGVNIVMGTGYYVEESHPDFLKNASVDSLAEKMVSDIQVGSNGIRAGILGEIGCSWPWTDGEKRSLAAAVAAQSATGAPLMIHPGRSEDAPFELLKFVLDQGGDLSRTILAHVERTVFSRELLEELAATGVYLEYDLFGHDSSYYPLAPDTHMPGDFERIRQLEFLCERGYADRLLWSHDIASKHRLRKYGGHGYDHILSRVTPWLRDRGFAEEDLAKISLENPRRILTIRRESGPSTQSGVR